MLYTIFNNEKQQVLWSGTDKTKFEKEILKHSKIEIVKGKTKIVLPDEIVVFIDETPNFNDCLKQHQENWWRFKEAKAMSRDNMPLKYASESDLMEQLEKHRQAKKSIKVTPMFNETLDD